jgi:quinol monooxygenase YgiN
MMIVLGQVQVVPEHMARAREISRQHVARSRTEPGCISHAVYEDPERPHLLVFVEEWESQEALTRHFAVPDSVASVKELGRLAAARPRMKLYQAVEQAP